jgi:hypothetical protein
MGWPEGRGVQMDRWMIGKKYRESEELYGGKAIKIGGLVQVASTPIPKPLASGLASVLAIVAYGLFLLHQDRQAFGVWIREDGLAEWLTFVELLMMSAYSFVIRAHFGHSDEERVARRVWLFFGFLFLFGAMEEISWAQRIFGIKSPEWFLNHNAQGETNVHNLVICGVKLNRLVFGKMLAMILGIYLLLVPLVYRINERLKRTVNRWRIPVAQNYQVLLFIVLAIAIRLHLGLSKKVEELLEFSGCYIMFLVVTHPYNHEIISFERVRTIWGAYLSGGRKRDHEDIS